MKYEILRRGRGYIVRFPTHWRGYLSYDARFSTLPHEFFTLWGARRAVKKYKEYMNAVLKPVKAEVVEQGDL